MARTSGPLFSLDASGSLGKTIVYSKWRGRNYVRQHVIPTNPRSGLQVGIRAVFGYMSSNWAALSDAIKADWIAEGVRDNITGLDAMIRYNVGLARRNLGWWEEPSPTPATTPNAPTSPTTTAQPKTLVLSWTAPGMNLPNYTYAIYASTVMGFTPDISNLVGLVPVTSTSFTMPGLTTGDTWYWVVRGTNSDGDLGALSTEGSGVVL
jgi:hypothetical protein